MDRDKITLIWLCSSSAFGLLATVSVPTFIVGSIVPIIFAMLAYINLGNERAKKQLLSMMGFSAIVGAIVGFFFNSRGEVSDFGLLVEFLAVIGICIFLRRIYFFENAENENGKGDGVD